MTQQSPVIEAAERTNSGGLVTAGPEHRLSGGELRSAAANHGAASRSSDGSGNLSALEQAGLRLDAAIAMFNVVTSWPTGDEERLFGLVEDAFSDAQSNYRNVLREVTGADPAVILARLVR